MRSPLIDIVFCEDAPIVTREHLPWPRIITRQCSGISVEFGIEPIDEKKN